MTWLLAFFKPVAPKINKISYKSDLEMDVFKIRKTH